MSCIYPGKLVEHYGLLTHLLYGKISRAKEEGRKERGGVGWVSYFALQLTPRWAAALT